ncbi:unnamed protein product [Peniophora sp. CBMAI 1063]|nr:unnamed protein product [Peniophora sp. CBMAI 1063]
MASPDVLLGLVSVWVWDKAMGQAYGIICRLLCIILARPVLFVNVLVFGAAAGPFIRHFAATPPSLPSFTIIYMRVALAWSCELLAPRVSDVIKVVLHRVWTHRYILAIRALTTVTLATPILLLYLRNCSPPPLPPEIAPTHAERRHQVFNVFVLGLRETVLLRVPWGASAAWVVRELDCRRLLRLHSQDARLGFHLLLCPRAGGAPCLLHLHQDLAQAGLLNNATIYFRYTVLGGARTVGTQAQSKRREYACDNCGRDFAESAHLKTHRTMSRNAGCREDASHRAALRRELKNAGLQPRPPPQRIRVPIRDDQPASPVAGPSRHAPMDIDPTPLDAMDVDPPSPPPSPPPPRSPPPPPPDPDGWGEEDDALVAQANGPAGRDAEGVLFDDEDDELEDQAEGEEGDGSDLGVEGDEEVRYLDHLYNYFGIGNDADAGAGEPAPEGAPPPPEEDLDPPPPQLPPQPAPQPIPPPLPSKRRTVLFGGMAEEPVNPGDVHSTPFADYESALPEGAHENPYHPFATKLDWDLAAWAKTHSIGSNALTDMLKIEGVVERLDLQYRNTHELNKILDNELPRRPDFMRHTYRLGGETLEMYARDALDVLKDLYARPDFASSMVFAPVKHFVVVDTEHGRVEERAYSDMHSARWWWRMQTKLEKNKPGVEHTQLTLFRNHSCYPVYLTIGNLPKELRRKTSLQGQVLLGYLPVTRLQGIKRDDVRQRAQASLFHDCMRDMLVPLRDVADAGVVLKSGDGVKRRCHPLIAAYVGDYPEQVLVAGVKYGTCPKGTLEPSKFGELGKCQLHDLSTIAQALALADEDPEDGDVEAYVAVCQAAGIKPLAPFWKDYPHVDIYSALTPDILHQLYQGVVKHLIS